MLGVLLTLLLISLPLTSTQFCIWEFHWSETLTDNKNITCLRPTSLNCSLYFNDKMRFYNGDTMDHKIYRVNDSQAYLDCDNTSLFINTNDETPPPVVVTARAFTMFNINGQKLDLSALNQAYLISEKIDGYKGGCFKMAFYIDGDPARDCPATRACINSTTPCPTTPPTTNITTPTTTTLSQGTTVQTAPLTTVQTALLVACCCLFFLDCVACVVLIVVVVYIMWRVYCEDDKKSFGFKGKLKGTNKL